MGTQSATGRQETPTLRKPASREDGMCGGGGLVIALSQRAIMAAAARWRVVDGRRSVGLAVAMRSWRLKLDARVGSAPGQMME